ncbi:helicase HerA domain-containing protein [Caldivirga sp.]|uniref:helicase HerA domain-containing protein n=1 Tax=Caldivirga sp. TaxID=2080243 RepID=UPI003D13736A
MEPVGYIIGNNGVDELTVIANPRHADDIKLFDYVYYNHGDAKVLAQVTGINRELYRVSDSLAPVVFNDGVKPVETVLVKLLIIGKKTGDLLKLPEAPPPVSTPVYQADPELVKSYLGLRGRLCIGYLASMQDVKVCLNEKAISRHMAIIGATGNGKTWLSVLVIEELLKLGATVLILDPHGEYVKAKETVSKMDNVGLTIFKLSKQHIGDLTYRVGLMVADPDHIASVSGIDDKAIRIREAFSLAHRCVKLAAKAYGDPKLATLRNMEKVLAQVASGRRIQVGMLQSLFGTKYPTSNLNGNKYFRRLSMILSELNNLTNESAGRHAALAARRYVRKLRRLGVYSPLSTRLLKLLKARHASVINLAGLDDSVQDHVAYSILNRVLKARINYVRRLPGPKYPYPVVIVVEEAHRFAPGNGRRTLTYSILSRIAMEGRKFGVFLVLITQRPSKIDQDILSQVQNYALLRIVNPKDREALLEAGELMNSNLDKILASLNIGESLIMGPMVGGQVPIVVKLRNRVLEYGGGDINLDKYWGIKSDENYENEVSRMMGLRIPKLTIERAKLLLDKISDESLDGSVVRGYVNGARVEVDLKNEVWSCSKCRNSMKPCEHVVALLLRKAMKEAELMRK